MASKEPTARPKTRNLLDDVTPEEIEKVRRHKEASEPDYKVDDHWMLLSEFAEAYGWDAYLDAKYDRRNSDGSLRVDTPEFMTLIEAHRKHEYMRNYRMAEMMFIALAASRSKTPSNTFRKLTQKLLKKTQVRE